MIVSYIKTIVPYVIDCSGYDYSISSLYCIKYQRAKVLPNKNEVDSLVNLLKSVRGNYENELLISEYIIFLEKIRRNYEVKM